MPNPAFSPLRRQKLSTQVLDRLRDAITSGTLQPSALLSEPSLSQQLGVSRSPIREALIELEREGLVKSDEKGRTRICSMTPQDFAEISSMRVAMESLAARWAAERWTPEHTAALEENIKAQEAAPNLLELSILDVEFHDYILNVSGHTRLLSTWQAVKPQFEMWFTHLNRTQGAQTLQPKSVTVTVHAHRRLLAVLAKGQGEEAERAMAFHVRTWQEWLSSAGLPLPAH